MPDAGSKSRKIEMFLLSILTCPLNLQSFKIVEGMFQIRPRVYTKSNGIEDVLTVVFSFQIVREWLRQGFERDVVSELGKMRAE